MSSYTDQATTIQTSLGLRTPPVAVTFCDAAPDGVSGPSRAVPAGCSFWELGADAAVATTAEDHKHCSIGIHTHNLADAPATQADELGAALGAMQGLDYVRPDEVRALPVMATASKYVVYGPLADATALPDVVLLFADAAQSLVLTEAIARVDGASPTAMGRPACALIPQVVARSRSAASLGCCGARAYLGNLSNDTTLWGLSGDKLAHYAREIEGLARANTVLTQFHEKRRAAIEAGNTPTVKESLAALS